LSVQPRTLIAALLLFAAGSVVACKKPKASKIRVADGLPAAAVGPSVACFFGTDGAVRCAGSGPLPGALSGTDRAQVIAALHGADELSFGAVMGCARFAQEVRCWGDNSQGLIAPGGAKQIVEPVRVHDGAKGLGVLPKGLCVLTQAGRLQCRGVVPGQPMGAAPQADWLDVAPEVFSRIHVFARAVCAQGSPTEPLRCWGASHPRPLGDKAAASVSCGETHCLAHTREGEVLEWALGDARAVAQALPVPAVQAVAGSRCVVLRNAQAVCASDAFGWDRAAPLPGLFGVAQIASGAAGTLFVTRAGGAYAYGPNVDFALGVAAAPLSVPMPVFVRQ
jgi:hypothetical protein